MGVKIGVLGGLGLMAEATLHDLLRNPAVDEVVAADLHLERKAAVAARAPRGRARLSILPLDLTDTTKSARTLKGTAVLINAAWYEFNLKAMDLARALHAHYVDLGGLYHMTLRQLKRDREFESAGLLAVLGCGSTPGITNMMVAAMCGDFDAIETVGIYDASHDPSLTHESFLPPFSIRTMLDEYVMPAPIWEGGRLVAAAAHSRPEPLEFRAPIGKCTAGAVIHSEVATLPAFLKDKGIKNLAFKIVYPESVKAQLGLLVGMGFCKTAPVRVNGSSVSPRSFVTALAQSAATAPAGTPGDFEVLRVRVVGARGGRALLREWDCELRPTKLLTAGAMGVGYTAAIVASMIRKGDVLRRSGVDAPESCLPAPAFFRELAARKVFRIVERQEKVKESF